MDELGDRMVGDDVDGFGGEEDVGWWCLRVWKIEGG